MTITTEITDKFKDKVEELIGKYVVQGQVQNLGNFLKELFDYAATQSAIYVPPRLELKPAHATWVDNTQLDYDSICLSMILISWAVRMRKIKSNEGQCHTHLSDCADTRKMHSEIYDQWIEVIQDTLTALKEGRPGQ